MARPANLAGRVASNRKMCLSRALFRNLDRKGTGMIIITAASAAAFRGMNRRQDRR